MVCHLHSPCINGQATRIGWYLPYNIVLHPRLGGYHRLARVPGSWNVLHSLQTPCRVTYQSINTWIAMLYAQ